MAGVCKIISGAQTGADRAALDWAKFREISHGGWCPKGRKSEDGCIPAHYQVTETPSGSYLQRTEWNVRDSDGTAIITISCELSGGSKRTADFAKKHGKPFIHLSKGGSYECPGARLALFMRENGIKTLNVAGSRESKEPSVVSFVKQVLESAFYPRPETLFIQNSAIMGS